MPSVSKEFYWTSDDWLFNRIKRDIELNEKIKIYVGKIITF